MIILVVASFRASDRITEYVVLENPKDFLLKSEKQRIVWEEIQIVRPMEDEHAVPGARTKSITPNNDTVRRCKKVIKLKCRN